MLACANRALNRRGITVVQQIGRVQQTSSSSSSCDYNPWQKRIGNREVMSVGMDNNASYCDDESIPFPAIRYRECTPQLMALREKERGDWRKLTIDEKKYLYRASFRQTFAEIQAPDTDWKSIVGSVLLGIAVSLWLYMFYHHKVLPNAPSSFSPEARIAQYYRQVEINNQPFSGNYRPPGAELRIHPKNKAMLKKIEQSEAAN